MNLRKDQMNNLDKLLKHNKDWLHKNDIHQTNKILAVLTFFIALGEISTISKNIFQDSISAFYIISILFILVVSIIFTIYQIRKVSHLKKMNKEGIDIIYGKPGHILGI